MRKKLDLAWFVVLLELLRPLPLRGAIRVLEWLSRIYYLARPDLRRRSELWLREASILQEQEIPAAVRRMFALGLFRRYLTELLLLHDQSRFTDLLHVEGWEIVERTLAGGSGAVLLSTHMGLPRLLRWHLRTRDCSPLFLLRIGFPSADDRSRGARFGAWHRKRYRFDDDEVAGDEELSVRYLKRAHRHLLSKGVVNIAGDGPSGNAHVEVTIAGRHQMFASGGVALGLLAGSPVIPCFTRVEPGPRFFLTFQTPLAGGSRESMVREYAGRIEQFITAYPADVLARRFAFPFTV